MKKMKKKKKRERGKKEEEEQEQEKKIREEAKSKEYGILLLYTLKEENAESSCYTLMTSLSYPS